MKKDRDQANHQTDKRYSVPLNSTSALLCSASSWPSISSRTGRHGAQAQQARHGGGQLVTLAAQAGAQRLPDGLANFRGAGSRGGADWPS